MKRRLEKKLSLQVPTRPKYIPVVCDSVKDFHQLWMAQATHGMNQVSKDLWPLVFSDGLILAQEVNDVIGRFASALAVSVVLFVYVQKV